MIRSMRAAGRLLAMLLAAGLSTACLGPGTTQPVRYYLLDVAPSEARTESQQAPVPAPAPVRVGIMPVVLPGYLDRPELVVRRGSEILPVAHTRWAAPLDDELARALGQQLGRALPGTDTAPFPWPRRFAPTHRLAVELDRFDIEDGEAVLHARWSLMLEGSRDTPVRRELRVRVAVTAAADDAAARVAALSAALTRLSDAVAQALGQQRQ